METDLTKNTFTKENKPELTDEEIKTALNIPPRDEVSYPMPTKEEIERAGQFLWKMNLLASSHDLNLQALIWDLYIKMDDFLHLDKENSSIQLAMSLESLKEYIISSNNPLLNKEEISKETEDNNKKE